MFDDYFDDDTISGGWTQTYQTLGSGVEYTQTSGINYLRIYSGEGSCPTAANGVYQEVVGDFDIGMNVAFMNLDAYSYQGYGCGMMVWIDANNYIVMHKDLNSFYHYYQYSYTGHGGGYSMSCGNAYLSPPFGFRFNRTSNIFIPYFADISGEWVDGESITLNTGTCNVWMFVNHRAGYDEGYVDFDYFITVS
jgi:hypothetical protein